MMKMSECTVGSVVYIKVNQDVIPQGYLKLIIREENRELIAQADNDYQKYNVKSWHNCFLKDLPVIQDSSEYTLLIKGFSNKKQVEEFINWYEGSGEQDSSVWFDARKQEGTIDVDNMPVCCKKTYPVLFSDGQAIMVLDISSV